MKEGNYLVFRRVGNVTGPLTRASGIYWCPVKKRYSTRLWNNGICTGIAEFRKEAACRHWLNMFNNSHLN